MMSYLHHKTSRYRLRPSSAHRWLQCPGSAYWELLITQGSIWADEGTLAHAYAARDLQQWLGRSHEAADNDIANLKGLLTDEMPVYVESYTVYVREAYESARQADPDSLLYIERRLDLTDVLHERGSRGTADALIVRRGVLDVIDLKYGRGVLVDSTLNPQLMIYALGALELVGLDYDIEQVRMTIVQPRRAHISPARMSVDELRAWQRDTLEPGVEEALKKIPRYKAGSWCRFCKYRDCPDRASKDAKKDFNFIK